MSSGLDKAIKDIIQVFQEVGKNKPAPFDTQAEVVRVDGDTAWVHIPGGVDETPVKLTINAKVGDKIQIHVGGGRAWITGNATAPPTDDRTAIYARTMASEAKVTAVQAQETAGEAQVTAKDAQGKASEAITKANGSVASDTLHYLATDRSSGVQISDSGWTTSIQTVTAAKPYLWIYHTYTKANGSTTHTQPVIIGTFGPKGDTGDKGDKGDKGDTGATGPQGAKGDKGDTGAQGAKGDKGDKGEDGQDGNDGISVTGVYPQYYQSTSASQLSGGSWLETLDYTNGRYIWTRERITYSNGSTSYSSAVYNSALTTAWINANSARQIAEDTNQYFWHTESGTDTGTHVTEKTQDDFLADPTNGGGNLLMRSNGIAIRNGLTELTEVDGDGLTVNDDTGAPVAEFLNIGSTVGKVADGQSRMVTSGTGMQFIRRSGSNDIVLAYIGYESSTILSPYYSMGLRKSGTYIGSYSMAEGYDTEASGGYSHAEGGDTIASGDNAHAEGTNTIASGRYSSHAEGDRTTASGECSHAEGKWSTASGNYSHAGGLDTIARGYSQTVIGKYSLSQGSVDSYSNTDYAFIIGNGISADNRITRSNAFTVDWNGNVMAQGFAGMIQMFGGAVTQTVTSGIAKTTGAPAGWLLCDGSILNVSEYPELADVLGSKYGGNGTTTFAVPDMRGRFPLGSNSSYPLNDKKGSANAVVVSHTHPAAASGYSYMLTHGTLSGGDMGSQSGSGRHYPYQGNRSDGAYWGSQANTGAASSGVSGAGKNMPPYIGINFIIATGKTR